MLRPPMPTPLPHIAPVSFKEALRFWFWLRTVSILATDTGGRPRLAPSLAKAS